jgi:hypothetical protein
MRAALNAENLVIHIMMKNIQNGQLTSQET